MLLFGVGIEINLFFCARGKIDCVRVEIDLVLVCSTVDFVLSFLWPKLT